MSEKKLTIEMAQVQEPPKKRKGLPSAGEGWSWKHDRVVMDRLARAIEGVPTSAMRRIAPWFSGVIADAMQSSAPAGPSVAGLLERP